MLLSELKNTIEQFMVYVHRDEADNIHKKTSGDFTYLFFAIFISLWGCAPCSGADK